MSTTPTVAIVGMGLLGGSLAEALRKRRPNWQRIGFSSVATTTEALNLHLIDEGYAYSQLSQILPQCDWVFLCTPIDSILSLLQKWAQHPPTFRPGAIVTDVGSTKSAICTLGKKAIPAASGACFIGSHPMAGSEKTGMQYRDPLLFENAAWILCPDVNAPLNAIEKLEEFIGVIGARSLRMSPEEHDHVIAQVSHLPQILSSVLAQLISHESDADRCLQVAGGGFRDMTRLAASKFSVWDPILRTNRDNMQQLLSKFRVELERVEISFLSQQNSSEIPDLEQLFIAANGLREKLSGPRKGFASPLTEILVDLEDKPGALLAALQPLALAGVNVLDLEILKVREGEEGVLMMGFCKSEEAQLALHLLKVSGHPSRLR